jgi:hypothetical protein
MDSQGVANVSYWPVIAIPKASSDPKQTFAATQINFRFLFIADHLKFHLKTPEFSS